MSNQPLAKLPHPFTSAAQGQLPAVLGTVYRSHQATAGVVKPQGMPNLVRRYVVTVPILQRGVQQNGHVTIVMQVQPNFVAV